MPKRATKRKQNKRTKKRTNKYTNRKKTRKFVNIFSKYLRGGGIIENLQPVIEIKNNSRLREKIADCYVFSKKQPSSGENKTYVVFQLNKGIHNSASSVSQGVAKGVGNFFVGVGSAVNAAYAMGGPLESWEQKSATYLLIEKLQSVLNNFTDKSTDKEMALGTKITGFSGKSFLTAKTLYVRMSSLKGDKQITCTNAAFNPKNPTDWINEVEPQETALDTLLETKSQYDKAWKDADNIVRTSGRASSDFKAAKDVQDKADEAKKIAQLNFNEVNKLTNFHYELNEKGDYDKAIKAAVDIVQPSQPAPTTGQPEQQAQIEAQQPAQTEEQQPAQTEEQQPAQTEEQQPSQPEQ
jgi:hypothetical protein